MSEPLTDEQLADYAALIDRATPVGAVTASPGILTVLLAEVQRLGEQVARLEDDRVRLLDQQAKDDDEYARSQAERDRYRTAWQSSRERAVAYGEGVLRITRDRESYQGWLKQEQAAHANTAARLSRALSVFTYSSSKQFHKGWNAAAAWVRDAAKEVAR